MSDADCLESCPFCCFLKKFIHDFEFWRISDSFFVDENNYHFLDPIKYLTDEIGVLPTTESIIAVRNYNQLLMCHELLMCHLENDHKYPFSMGWLFSPNWKLKLKWFLQEHNLLIPSVQCVDDDFGKISYSRSRITDCNYYIEPINQTAANCLV